MDLILKAITFNLTLLCRLFSGSHPLNARDEKQDIEALLLHSYRLFLLLEKEHQVTHAVLAPNITIGRDIHYSGTQAQQAIQEKCAKIFRIYLGFRDASYATYPILGRGDIARVAAAVLVEIAQENNDFAEDKLEQQADAIIKSLDGKLKHYAGNNLPVLTAPAVSPSPPTSSLLLMRSTPMQEAIHTMIRHFDSMLAELKKDETDASNFELHLSQIAEELWQLSITVNDLELVEASERKLLAKEKPKFPLNKDADPELKLLEIIFELFKFSHSTIDELKHVLTDYESILKSIKNKLPKSTVLRPPVSSVAAAARMPRPSLNEAERKSVRQSMRADELAILMQWFEAVTDLPDPEAPYKTIIEQLNKEEAESLYPGNLHEVGVSRYDNFKSLKDNRFPFYSANSLSKSICVAEGPRPINAELESHNHALRFLLSTFYNPYFEKEPINLIIVAGRHNEQNGFLNYYDLTEPLMLVGRVNNNEFKLLVNSQKLRGSSSGNIVQYEVTVNDGISSKTIRLFHLPNFKDFSVATLTDDDVAILHNAFNEIQRANHNLLIHCAAGRGRSGTLALAMLLANEFNNHYANGSANLDKIKELLQSLRRIRPGLVQTGKQLMMAIDLARQFNAIDHRLVEEERMLKLMQNADRTNIATLHFTLGEDRVDQRLFNSWYSDKTLRYLIHLYYAGQRDAVAYIFEGQYKHGFSFAQQLSALVQLKNRDRKTRACFILTEPAASETSHFMLGLITDKIILFINPTGLPTHQEFYAQLMKPEVAVLIADKKIFITRDVFQKDENGLQSCGPISAELALSFATLSAEQLETQLNRTAFITEEKAKLKYYIISALELHQHSSYLPDLLVQLLNIDKRYYENKIIELRQKHFNMLQRAKRDTPWEDLYNAPSQIAIATHCTGGLPILSQGQGSYDPLRPPLLKSNRPEINHAIAFIFLCIESFNKEPQTKLSFIFKALNDLNNKYQKEFKLISNGSLRDDPVVELLPPDSPNPQFHHLFRAFCLFVKNAEHRRKLQLELPNRRALFEQPPLEAVFTYARDILNIEERQLQFLKPAHTQSLSRALSQPLSNRQTTVLQSLPAAASPAKSKDKSKVVISSHNVDPTYCYDDWDITVVSNAQIVRSRIEGGEIGGFAVNREYLLTGINDDGTFNEDGTHTRYHVAVTPSVTHVSLPGIDPQPIDYFLNKVHQAGDEHSKRDVFDELVSILRKDLNCSIKILFPFNDNSIFHWLLGEIQIHQQVISDAQVGITVNIYAHDPFGHGKMPDENYQALCKVIKTKLSEIYRRANIAEPTLTFNQKNSPYEGRQTPGDSQSCGAIVVDDLRLRILGHSLDERLCPISAIALRQKQLDDVLRVNHAIVSDAAKAKFKARITATSSATSKSKIEPRSVAYTIDNMNAVIEATKNADPNAGGLGCHIEKGCAYLLHDKYPEHSSKEWYQVALLPAVALNTIEGDPAHAMPIVTYLDRTKNIEACATYLLIEINNAITAKKNSLNHIKVQKLESFKLMMETEPFKSVVIDPAIRDRVYEEVHRIITNADFNEHKLASIMQDQDIEKHMDVFEDLQQLFEKEPVCNVKILFPLRLLMPEGDAAVMRHLLVEIKINRNNDDIKVDILTHDPRGKGQLPSNIYKQLVDCVYGKLIHSLRGATITISQKQPSSPFEARRVAKGDRSTTPAIVVEEMFCRTRGEQLVKSYPATASELRKQHAARVAKLDSKAKNRKTFFRNQVILHTTKTGYALQRGEIKPLTADGKLNIAYVVYKLRGICRELLNENVNQQAIDKKFDKVISAFKLAQSNCTREDTEQVVFFNSDASAKNPPSISTGNPIRDRVITGCFDIYQLLYIISIQSLAHENRREVVRRILASLEKLQADSKKLMPSKKEFVKGPTSHVTDVRLHIYQDETSGNVIGKTVVQKEITGVLRRTRIDSVKRWAGIIGGSGATLGISWFLTAVIAQHFSLDTYVVSSVAVPLVLFLIVLMGSIYMTRNCCLRPYTAQTIEGDRFSLFATRTTVQREATERTALIGDVPPMPYSYASKTPVKTGFAVTTRLIEEEDVRRNEPIALSLEAAEEGRAADRQYAAKTRPQSLAYEEGTVAKTAARVSGELTNERIMQSAKAQANHRMTLLFPGAPLATAATSSSSELVLPDNWEGMFQMGDRATLRHPVHPDLLAAVRRAEDATNRLAQDIGGTELDPVAALDDLVDPEALARSAARRP